MKFPYKAWYVTIIAVFAFSLAVWSASGEFAFVPPGGADLLVEVLERCPSCGDLQEISRLGPMSPGEWRDYFQEHDDALARFSEREADTLASYLAHNFPLEATGSAERLPPDGRLLALQHCMLCHSIAIPITQDRGPQQWMALVRVPPHDLVNLTEVQWRTLAGYLAHSAPVPLEDIPPELWAGGAGY